VHPGFRVDADGAVQGELLREQLQQAVSHGYGYPGDPAWLAMARLDLGPEVVESALGLLLQEALPPAALDEDPLSRERADAYVTELGAVLAAFGESHELELESVSGWAKGGRVQQALAASSTVCASADTSSVAALDGLFAELREIWAPARAGLREFARGRLNKGETAALGGAAASFSAAASALIPWIAHLVDVDPLRLDATRRVLRPLYAELAEELRARGAETFGALLTRARELLRGYPRVAERVRAGIDQLLVDEFQDTDETQCGLVEAIALAGPSEDRPGLFIVGDPKQSIYGWRRADLEAYEAFIGRVRSAGGQVRRLHVNFRSVPAILAEVERIVAPIMQETPRRQPAFEALVACDDKLASPGFETPEHAPVEHWVSWPFADGAPRADALVREANELEATAVATDLRRLHDVHGVEWKRAALLFRSRGDYDIYLGALREAGVPFAVEGDRRYYQRREIIEASALVRCVVDPHDQLSLLTWLRSVSVGVPDAALVPLWTEQLPEALARAGTLEPDELAEIRQQALAAAARTPDVPGIERLPGWELALDDAIVALDELRRSWRDDPTDVFVERLRTRTLIEGHEAARFLGAYRCANLERFFRELAADLAESEGGPQRVMAALRRRVREASDADEAAPDESERDAVQIMTIHAAKGLDWDHVYLLQTHKGMPGNRGRQDVFGRIDDRWEYRIAGAPTLGAGALAQRRDEVEEFEQVRTLYVALTRARERLVIAGAWPFAGKGGRGGYMRLLRTRCERAGFEPEELLADARANAGRIDRDGARWVFTGAPELRTADVDRSAHVETERADAPPAAADPAESARACAERGEHALQHQARPFGAAASEAAHAKLHRDLADQSTAQSIREARRSRAGAAVGERIATRVGTAVHAVLEHLDPEAEPEAELERARAWVCERLDAELPPAERESARERAAELLDRFAAGPLLPHLQRIAGHIVARELPLLVPPSDEPAGSGEGAVGYTSGIADLVYRDPDDGAWIVADYKTDRVESGPELERRAQSYAAQGEAYTRALERALELSEPPRFELWFLHAAEIVTL